MSLRLKSAVVAVAAVLSVAGGVAVAQSVESAVKARVDLMKEFGENSKVLIAAAKGGPVNADVAKAAQAISTNMAKIPALFPAGSGDDKHPTTRAKADIWSKWATFEGYAKSGQSGFAAAAAAAENGDADAFKAAYAKAGESCNACHKEFRGPRR